MLGSILNGSNSNLIVNGSGTFKSIAGSYSTIKLDATDVVTNQPVDINLGSSKPKGIRIYASVTPLTSSPSGAGFQMYSNSAETLPGQMYFDSGANNAAFISFRTAQTGGNITERMRINASGNVLIAPGSDNGSGAKLQVNGNITATNIMVSSSSLVANLNAQYLNGQLGSYYQALSTSINTGNIANQSVYSSNFINSRDIDRTSLSNLPNSITQKIRFDFVNANVVGATGSFAGIMTYSPYDGTSVSTGDASYQLAFGGTAVNGGGVPMLRIRKGIDTTWNSFYTIWHEGNFTPSNYRLNSAPSSGSYFQGTPIVQADGGINIGQYLNFHDTNASTSFSARLTSSLGDLTCNMTMTAINFIIGSDRRLKTKIKPIDRNYLEVKYKEFELISNPGEKRYGVIAQDILKIAPELVTKNSEGIMAVKYIDLLIRKIAELEYRIKKMEDK